MLHLVPVLGLFVMLGIAWALSVEPRRHQVAAGGDGHRRCRSSSP